MPKAQEISKIKTVAWLADALHPIFRNTLE
jgi:hypothetical protein